MSETQVSTEALERQVRRLKYGFGVCVIFSALPWVMGQTISDNDDGVVIKKIIFAESFVVIDKQQKQRAMLGFIEGDGTSLTLMDGNGKPRAVLRARDGHSASLTLTAPQGKSGVFLALNEKENASLFFVDRQGSTTVSISGMSNGVASVDLNNSEHAARLSVDKKGSYLSLDESRVLLAVDDVRASMAVQDKYGRIRTGIGELKGQSFLQITGADGKLQFTKP